jgi:hypothetical protein
MGDGTKGRSKNIGEETPKQPKQRGSEGGERREDNQSRRCYGHIKNWAVARIIKLREGNIITLLKMLVIIWAAWGAYYAYSRDWKALEAIATWLLALGIVFAILQVYQARKSTNAQLAVELFRELRGEETKNTLRFIYQLKAGDTQRLCSVDVYNIDSVIDKFELLGALVNQGIIDKRLAIEAFAGPLALRCWYQLAPYIREQEKARGFFVANYEDFVRGAVEYFESEHVKIVFSQKGDKDKYLVKEFRELINKKDKLRPRKLEEIKQERKNNKIEQGVR